jgi:hypothetical protein
VGSLNSNSCGQILIGSRHVCLRQRLDAPNSRKYLLGVGIGGISAAAVSSASSVAELLTVSLHAIRIVFRVRNRAFERGKAIGSHCTGTTSWSVEVPGFSTTLAQAAVNEFNNERVRMTGKVY